MPFPFLPFGFPPNPQQSSNNPQTSSTDPFSSPFFQHFMQMFGGPNAFQIQSKNTMKKKEKKSKMILNDE